MDRYDIHYLNNNIPVHKQPPFICISIYFCLFYYLPFVISLCHSGKLEYFLSSTLRRTYSLKQNVALLFGGIGEHVSCVRLENYAKTIPRQNRHGYQEQVDGPTEVKHVYEAEK